MFVSMTEHEKNRLSEIGRAPVLGAVAVPASGPAFWRAAWSARHTVTTLAAGAALYLALAAATPAMGWAGTVLLALAALVGGVTVATYVPPRGVPAKEHVTGGSCAIMPLMIIAVAPFMLAQAPASALTAAALVVFYFAAAVKRITDHASC